MIEGQPDPGPGNAQDALYRPVTRDYFATIGAVVKEGRTFNAEDRPTSPLVTVINEHMARLHWGDRSPLGGRVLFGDRAFTVIGVVKDLRERGIDIPMKPATYLMIEQVDSFAAFLAVRTESDPATLAKAVTAAIWSLDKDQPVSLIRTMDQIVEVQLENRSLQMTLLTIFAALALSLASLGIYGVLSYLVTQRVREIGVRMALGATARQVLGMFVGQGLGLTAVGLTIGGLVSVLLGRGMRTMLYEVAPTDFRVYAGVAAVLSTVAFLACYIPARRAARVDPMVALRDE
jgi:putative ABC transport system permease protein